MKVTVTLQEDDARRLLVEVDRSLRIYPADSLKRVEAELKCALLLCDCGEPQATAR